MDSSEIVLVDYHNGSIKLLSNKTTEEQNVEFNNSKEEETIDSNYIVVHNDQAISDLDMMFCDLCHYQTTKKKLLTQHMVSNHFQPDRSCHICGKRLNKMQLRLHMRFHDLKFVCDYCGKRFGDSKALRKHKNSKVCGEKYQAALPFKTHKCDFCNFRTHTAKLLMTHFRTLHVPKDISCPHCAKEMTSKQYQSHKNYCNQGYFYCKLCPKKYVHPKYLKDHERKKHASLKIEENLIKTEVTNIESDLTATNIGQANDLLEIEENLENADYFTEVLEDTEYSEIEQLEEEPIEFLDLEQSESVAENEQDTMNSETVQYCCSICRIITESLDDLLSHMNECHQFCDNECPICHKTFSKQALSRHMRYHNKNHVCEKCGRGFAEASLLKAHLERKSSCLGLTLEELQQDPTYMQKQYSCVLCLYRGTTAKHLSKHIQQTHSTAPKDMECPDCGKQLTRFQWHSHRKTHIKLKCPICHKWLSDSKFFKIHVKNHNNPKNTTFQSGFQVPEKSPDSEYYCCTQCEFQTKQRRFLVQHYKVKHAPKEFTCEFEECTGKTFTQTQLRLHKRFHNLSFKCEKCNAGFPDSRDLRRHIEKKNCFKERKRRKHTKDVIDTNETEKIETKRPPNKMRRKETENNRTEKIDVEPISMKFESDITEESAKPQQESEYNPCAESEPNEVGIYECKDCNYETDSLIELVEHWNQFHAPRNQPCSYPQCSGKLFSKAQLKLHMRFHLKKLITKDKEKPKTDTDDDTSVIFQCVLCDFKTNKELYLKQHIQINHASTET
uniref:CSON000360 protein n=1 Tax=Culicoides sonorensis TaxID=179676 RepID=A0A336MJZ9_CULSO